MSKLYGERDDKVIAGGVFSLLRAPSCVTLFYIKQLMENLAGRIMNHPFPESFSNISALCSLSNQ